MTINESTAYCTVVGNVWSPEWVLTPRDARVTLWDSAEFLKTISYKSIMHTYHQETKSVLLLFGMMINDNEKG